MCSVCAEEVRRGRIKEYAEAYDGVTFREGQDPWDLACDLAFPCATQNELDAAEAAALVSNGCMAVAEGAMASINTTFGHML